MELFTGTVRDLSELAGMPEEYRLAVSKIVVSHAVNEMAGAEAYDEPAIRLAPTPYHKWLAKAIGDLAEVVMVEELEHCSFLPLRDLAVKTMPEEKFHAGFGRDQMGELLKTSDGREVVQRAVDLVYPAMLPFLGISSSRNSALFRQWGIKRRTNDEMRADYAERVKRLVEGEFGLKLPGARRGGEWAAPAATF